MANKQISSLKRLEIFTHFEGVNSLISNSLFKKGELSHCENMRSTTIGVAEKRAGFTQTGSDLIATANYGIFFFNEAVSATNKGFYRISTVSGITSIYYLNGSDVWTALTEKGTNLTAGQFSITFANKCCFLVNGLGNNRYIDSDGVTVVDSDTKTGHLYGSPKAKKIKHYKDRLYLADYIVGSARKKNGVMMSSFPVGIVALVDGDHADVSSGDEIKVTDTKYINTIDTLDIYRGNEKIADITISAKTEDTITIDTITLVASSSSASSSVSPSASISPSASTSISPSASLSPSSSVSVSPSSSLSPSASTSLSPSSSISPSASSSASISPSASVSPSASTIDFNSSDEIWVNRTYNADKIFRWANNENSGINVQEYDSFFIGGNSDSKIKMFETIGDVLMIGINDNIAVWDGNQLKNFDLGIGCISDKGCVKSLGSLFFLGYDGIFQTSGGQPKLISAKVEKYIDGATKDNLEAAATGKKGYSIFCSIGDITLYNPDGSINMTLSNVILEFNARVQEWYVQTGIKVTEFATYVSASNVKNLQFASEETNYPIMEFLTGETDDSSGEDREILFRIDSSDISLAKEFENVAYIHKIIIESERGSNIQCFISLNKEPFYEIKGTARKGITRMTITNKDGDRDVPPRCNTIKISLRDFSKQICKISRVALTYIPTVEKEDKT